MWFDIGHGMGSLDFEVAARMIEEGFRPDVISSDVHALCAGDSATFDADLPHHLHNPGGVEARLLAVVAAGLRRS